jgi:hypothetical protein
MEKIIACVEEKITIRRRIMILELKFAKEHHSMDIISTMNITDLCAQNIIIIIAMEDTTMRADFSVDVSRLNFEI